LGPSYRGIAVFDLVREKLTFEQVAERFWTAGVNFSLPWRPCSWTVRAVEARANAGHISARRDLVRFLTEIALSYGGAQRRRPVTAEVQLSEASCLIATMVQCLVHLRRAPEVVPARRHGSIAAMLLSGLGAAVNPETIAAVDAALILCADHELAQATFVARIAASAGADMGECIAAAILTQTGLTAARSHERTEDFLRGCRTAAQARRLFDAEYEAHRNLPGFNHPLYPEGDPRATYVIGVARRLAAPSPAVAPLYAALDIAAERGCLPSLEVGLLVLATALGLPARGACALFIVGRTAGWVAHIMEQRTSGIPLRPRADYLQGGAPAPLHAERVPAVMAPSPAQQHQ
jgi:citrate synthase